MAVLGKKAAHRLFLAAVIVGLVVAAVAGNATSRPNDDRGTTAAQGRDRVPAATGSTSARPRPIGRPSLLARLPLVGLVADGGSIDADGDFIVWVTGPDFPQGCTIHFLRISDRRRVQVRKACADPEREAVHALALNRSRAVWATEWASNTEQGVDIGTATFERPRSRWVARGEDGCDEAPPCNADPIITSSGGSLVAQFFRGHYFEDDVRTVIAKVGVNVERLPIAPGTDLAVHGDTLAVARDGSAELRRLRGGGLLRTVPLRRKGGLVLSRTLLVVESGYQQRRIDLYDRATGRFLRTVRYRGSNAQPVADGVLFFSGHALRYVSRSGGISTLMKTVRKPGELHLGSGRLIWVTDVKGKGYRVHSIRYRLGR